MGTELGQCSTWVLIVLAFFLPPLAVALDVGCGWEFWVSLLLTFLAWIPGVIFSLLIIIRKD